MGLMQRRRCHQVVRLSAICLSTPRATSHHRAPSVTPVRPSFPFSQHRVGGGFTSLHHPCTASISPAAACPSTTQTAPPALPPNEPSRLPLLHLRARAAQCPLASMAPRLPPPMRSPPFLRGGEPVTDRQHPSRSCRRCAHALSTARNKGGSPPFLLLW